MEELADGCRGGPAGYTCAGSYVDGDGVDGVMCRSPKARLYAAVTAPSGPMAASQSGCSLRQSQSSRHCSHW